MTAEQSLRCVLGRDFSLVQTQTPALQLYAPFFHEDGDMYSIYLEDVGNEEWLIRDYGNTLMRVSYTFEIDTDNKRRVIEQVVKSNDAQLDDGELIIKSRTDALPVDILRYTQLVAKTSNITILQREVVRSMFYNEFGAFVNDNLAHHAVKAKFAPTDEPELDVDFMIPGPRPLFLFGVNDDSKASKVVISCLSFQNQGISFRSIVVHGRFDELTRFNRNRLTDAADKQFTSLDFFKREGVNFIEREL
jgi:hypothetical protein